MSSLPQPLPAPPVVSAGVLCAMRLFDVAYAIDLDHAARIWAQAGQPAATRARFGPRAPRTIGWNAPPLELDLGQVELQVDGLSVGLAAHAHVYAYGVLTLLLDWVQHEQPWDSFAVRMRQLDVAVDSSAGADLWHRLRDNVFATLRGALQRPLQARVEEDYLIAQVQQWQQPITAGALQQTVDLAALLSGERDALAEDTRRELLRYRHSYFTDDLVALTWDRALIVDPRGDADALRMIEQANAQLLELRWYDAVLNEELPRMDVLVRGTRRPFSAFVPGRMAGLARRLQAQVAEVNELVEKVDNTLQVTGDTWLARVHASARDALGVHGVAAALERKLGLMRETYRGLYEEAAGLRATLLEVTIVVLIALEIVLAFWQHG